MLNYKNIYIAATLSNQLALFGLMVVSDLVIREKPKSLCSVLYFVFQTIIEEILHVQIMRDIVCGSFRFYIFKIHQTYVQYSRIQYKEIVACFIRSTM